MRKFFVTPFSLSFHTFGSPTRRAGETCKHYNICGQNCVTSVQNETIPLFLLFFAFCIQFTNAHTNTILILFHDMTWLYFIKTEHGQIVSLHRFAQIVVALWRNWMKCVLQATQFVSCFNVYDIWSRDEQMILDSWWEKEEKGSAGARWDAWNDMDGHVRRDNWGEKGVQAVLKLKCWSFN